jgi:cyclophilin family peptidyl-prolyl cis-trans isomerase
LVCWFLLLPVLSFAADGPGAPAKEAAAAVPPGPKNAEFTRLLGQWKTFLGDAATLQVQYRSADANRRAEIETQWKQLMDKGDAMQAQLIAAAEKAYAEAPNTNREVTDLLVAVLAERIRYEEYEPALALGRLLLDNKCRDQGVPKLAGEAAFVVGDLDAAEKYLTAAAKTKALTDPGRSYLADMAQSRKAWEKEQSLRAAEAKADDLPRVLLTTNKGDIELELFENEAPNTVANFISLVEKGFYNGLTFHRVIPNFMAQGGDPTGDGTGGPGYSIACECYQPNHRLHFRGSLSMAHAGRDTGGSQFFLTFLPTTFLDGHHTVFGRVTSGMDVLAKLQRRNPGKIEQPPPDKILTAKVLRKRAHKYEPKKVK